MGAAIFWNAYERRVFDQGSVLIGRGSACPIRLPDAAHLREDHARLRKVGDRWMVESRGDWTIRVGDDAPAKFGWLKVGDVIRLSQDGPELVFEPADEDVVLIGLETPEVASTTHSMPPPSPVWGETVPEIHPGRSEQSITCPTPPPHPRQAAPTPSTWATVPPGDEDQERLETSAHAERNAILFAVGCSGIIILSLWFLFVGQPYLSAFVVNNLLFGCALYGIMKWF